MPTPRGLFAGKKLNNTHSTVISVATPIIKALKAAGFDKIRPNQIRAHHGRRRYVIHQIPAGLRLVLYDTVAHQVFHVYTGEPERAERVIASAWDRHYGS